MEKLQIKITGLEKKLSFYERQTETSSMPDLLTEKVQNLYGILMGHQQEMDAFYAIDHDSEKRRAGSLARISPQVQENPLSEEDEFPGVSFYESARRVSITSEESTVDYGNELGLTLSIPADAVEEGQTIDLIIRPAFSGPFAGHKDMEPASPAYLVQPSKEVCLKKDIVVRIQHSASISTTTKEGEEEEGEGCSQDLVFLTASFAPQRRGSLFGPLYVFHKVVGKEARFDRDEDGNCLFGELRTDRFSWFMIWRRRKVTPTSSGCGGGAGEGEGGAHLCLPSVYSARLYRGDAECKGTAVFCVCQQHPQYIKYCDEVIPARCKVSGACFVADSVVITNDEVTVEVLGAPSCDRAMNKGISKVDIDLPLLLRHSSFYEYPPKVAIQLGNPSMKFWTVIIAGLTEKVLLTVSDFKPDNQERKSSGNDWRPSLKALLLIQWTDEAGSKNSYQLVEKVGARWKDIGTLLGLPQDKLDSWGGHYKNKAPKCWQKVMKCWLKRRRSEEYPGTWDGLYSLLETLGCDGEAKEMKDSVESVKSALRASRADLASFSS